MQRTIKFRQWNGDRWHYWGFINDSFVAPIALNIPSDQFTGLKDKNGHDVYEGAIVKTEYGVINQVSIARYGAAYMHNAERDKHTLLQFDFNGDFSKIEVIGNLTESPELLEANS